MKLKDQLEWFGNWLSQPPEVSFVTLKPDALAGMQWPRPPRDYVAELKAEIQKLRTPTKPQLAPEPVKPPEPVQAQPEPEPEPSKPQSKPLTQEQTALRDRVLNTESIPLPKGIPWIQHDCGLIHDEDVDVLYGHQLDQMYAEGCTRAGILRTLKAFPREYLNEFWPDIFPLDTT